MSEMSRKILENFMDHVRLTEGYIWFNYKNMIYNNIFNDNDVFSIKDGQNRFLLGILIISDNGILIRRTTGAGDGFDPPGRITFSSPIFEKEFSDPDCNPRYISEVIDKMILEDPRNNERRCHLRRKLKGG